MLIGCVGILIAAAGFVTEMPETLKTMFTSTNEVNGAFVQTKVNGSDGRTYVTTGTYRIRPGIDFEWKTLDPFETRFYSTPTNYVYANEDEQVARPLKDLPGFSKFATAMQGDFASVFKAFDALYREENGRFFLKAKPKISDLKRFLVRVDAEGNPTNWTMTAEFPDKTTFKIDFKNNLKYPIDQALGE